MKYILILCLFISTLSCKKDTTNPICADGTIEWEGDPAVDGSGWVFKQGTNNYILKDLPAAYQQSGRSVSICMKKTGTRAPCFCTTELYYYSIVSIQ